MRGHDSERKKPLFEEREVEERDRVAILLDQTSWKAGSGRSCQALVDGEEARVGVAEIMAGWLLYC